MEIEKSKLNCSFCGKEQVKVKKLILGQIYTYVTSV